jgi:hypothetical protein
MASPLATPLSDFTDRRHLTYPHSNGWVGRGEALILAERRDASTAFIRYEIVSGQSSLLSEVTFPNYSERRCVFFDVVDHTLAYVGGQGIYILDLSQPASPSRLVAEFPAGITLGDLVSFHPDGSRVIVHGFANKAYRCWEVILKTGARREIWSSSWHANHFHYLPHNPDWIGFSHEGPAHEIADRPWVFKAGSPETARCVFDQTHLPVEKRLNIGHELWAHHADSGLAVAYVGSLGRPRGLYEIFADGRPARLVSEGDRDWHANLSRDGRWAVVDTSAPLDQPQIEFDPAGAGSDIVLIDMQTGHRRVLARTLATPHHPAHPHPVFSPNGRHVFYNESTPDHQGYRVCRVAV